ncbi:hypothetical protein [Deinococcus cellulosilyticus]|uniref:Uncharacterized protein n=1 Tax=Deinococcus cellulosilyticus (strain DSM 18568 / NBRC 106333 / KACC 11606 / 5516J-15) TaxID=1223518 RepID=A0A511MWH0_DEIC1|nr:hypothetical protein [Deinococcus cellulosilyticus]GEM44517.1 hypothetical protein DC3_01520 [Deinococcus cellulosilyticus NBRC 106333 = KACC 11606]
MTIRSFLARHPQQRRSQPLIIEDLLKMAEASKHEAVNACLAMCEDLYINGSKSRYVHSIQGSPLFELRTDAENQKACARVYFYWRNPEEVVLVHAETSDHGRASMKLLNGCAAVRSADLQGRDVLDGARSL